MLLIVNTAFSIKSNAFYGNLFKKLYILTGIETFAKEPEF